MCNDTITATGVFSSKELWKFSKGKCAREPCPYRSCVASVLPGLALLPSSLGLSSIKLESPAYYCTSYTPPCSEPGLISSQYGGLSLTRPHSPGPQVSLADGSTIRVKRMRRMSSEGEEAELRGEGKVGDLYYSQSPLGQASSSWSQADLEQAASIGQSSHSLCSLVP